MDSRYNNLPIEMNEWAISKSFSVKTADRSAKRLKEHLWAIINDEESNQKLYWHLEEQGFNKPVRIKSEAVEILPGKYVSVYFTLVDSSKVGRNVIHGSFGTTNNKEMYIEITLYGNTNDDLIEWHDSYLATIDHEIAHGLQYIEFAIRYLRFYNRHNSNYKIDYNEVMKLAIKISYERIEKIKQRTKNLEEIEKYYSYLHRDLEARAKGLLIELASYQPELLRDVLNSYRRGKPSLKYIDKEFANSGRDWHGWKELDDFQKDEQSGVLYVPDENTQGYHLKQELIKKLYLFYMNQYKRGEYEYD